ncbi:MAG: transposase [Rickettsia sp.]|nr:transposase [Rickettsia sp.]
MRKYYNYYSFSFCTNIEKLFFHQHYYMTIFSYLCKNYKYGFVEFNGEQDHVIYLIKYLLSFVSSIYTVKGASSILRQFHQSKRQSCLWMS